MSVVCLSVVNTSTLRGWLAELGGIFPVCRYLRWFVRLVERHGVLVREGWTPKNPVDCAGSTSPVWHWIFGDSPSASDVCVDLLIWLLFTTFYLLG